MKQNIILIILFALLISCESKYPIEIKQITSKEIVTIENNYMDRNKIKDSFRISIPTEYEIKINSYIYYMTWLYKVNNIILNQNHIDYQVYDKRNLKREILELNFEKSFKEKVTIIIKERNHLISKKDALQLLKKYNIHKSLDSLKSNNTIKLVSYDKFRKENKMFIQELNKISDSIHFTTMKKDGSFFYVNKKINW